MTSETSMSSTRTTVGNIGLSPASCSWRSCSSSGRCHVTCLPPWEIRPYQKGAIFSSMPSFKNSPPCDLFTTTVCEKIAPPLFGREKFARTHGIFERGRFSHVVNKTLLSWKNHPLSGKYDKRIGNTRIGIDEWRNQSGCSISLAHVE